MRLEQCFTALRLSNESIAKVNPEIIPQNTPCVMLFDTSIVGTTIATPEKVIRATMILDFLKGSLKSMGSRKVTNMGKVENVSSPIATVDI